jgi:hypothetical protein
MRQPSALESQLGTFEDPVTTGYEVRLRLGFRDRLDQRNSGRADPGGVLHEASVGSGRSRFNDVRSR